MGIEFSDALSIKTVGVTVTSSGTGSAAATWPTKYNATVPKFVRVVSPTVAYFKMGGGTVVATANDIMITSTPQVLNVSGHTHYSVIQDATTTAGKVNITPIEW